MPRRALPFTASENIDSELPISVQAFSPKVDRLPIAILILDDNPATGVDLSSLLNEHIPEASVFHTPCAHSLPDIVFYSTTCIARIGTALLERYRSSGAALVAVMDCAEELSATLRLALSPVLAKPLIPSAFAALIEPLRNHVAEQWLQRGMGEIVEQAGHLRRKRSNYVFRFPTALGEQEFTPESVLLFESQADETILHFAVSGGTARPTIAVYMRLGAIETLLTASPVKEHFLRVHKSFTVNLRHVLSAAPLGNNPASKDLTLHLAGGALCTCSRTYKSAFHQAMMALAEDEGGSWEKQGGLWKRG
jgi:DNA-binding LytR/AlgR family response regulator